MFYKAVQYTTVYTYSKKCVITIDYVPTWIGKLFNKPTKRDKYIGSHQHWYKLPACTSCTGYEMTIINTICKLCDECDLSDHV